jgi:hypothetical protein
MPNGRKKRSARNHKAADKNKATQAKVPAAKVTDLVIEGGKVVQGMIVGPQISSFLFWNDPPQPDPLFAPFYRRAVTGDFQALVDFYRQHGHDLGGGAFFQCIGYLAALGSPQEMKVVEKIMGINARGGPLTSTVAKRGSIREWEHRVLPIAQAARKWISEQPRAGGQPWNVTSGREKLWSDYLREKIRPKDSAAFSSLLTNFSRDGTETVGNNHRAALTPKESRVQQRESQRFITSLALSHGVIPKPLFFMLAQTTPRRLSSSTAVRRFVEKIVI